MVSLFFIVHAEKTVFHAADGTFSLRSSDNTKMVVDASGYNSADGTKIILWSVNELDAPGNAELRFTPAAATVTLKRRRYQKQASRESFVPLGQSIGCHTMEAISEQRTSGRKQQTTGQSPSPARIWSFCSSEGFGAVMRQAKCQVIRKFSSKT